MKVFLEQLLFAQMLKDRCDLVSVRFFANKVILVIFTLR